MSESIDSHRFRETHPFDTDRLSELRISQRRFLYLIPPDLRPHVREVVSSGVKRRATALDNLIELQLREVAEVMIGNVAALRDHFEVEATWRCVIPALQEFLGEKPTFSTGSALLPIWEMQNVGTEVPRSKEVAELPEIVAILDLADFLANDGFSWTPAS